MNENLLRTAFDKLQLSDKLAIMHSLAKEYKLAFKSLWVFSRWGQRCTTGIFETDGSEFVFVPGDMITVGTDLDDFSPDKNDARELTSVFDEIGYSESAASFIKASLIKPHTARIPPMLVEREVREIGWEATDFSDERLKQGKPSPLEAFWQNEYSGISQFTVVNRAKFVKRGIDWQPYVCNATTYTELKRGLAQSGFALPTADEWAYLCGGGRSSLFAWGDSCSQLRLRHFDESVDARGYDLEQPNFFGLVIGFDPYKRELVDAEVLTTCGGDGGENVCGGVGRLLGYLPCSPHFLPQTRQTDDIRNEFDYMRRVIRIV